MGNSHVKSWALVVVGFGYFAVFGSVVGIIATFVADYDSEILDLTWRLMGLSGFLTGSLLILVGSYVLWKVELTEGESDSSS